MTVAAALRIPRSRLAALIFVGVGQAMTLVMLVLLLRAIIDGLAAPSDQVRSVAMWIALLACILLINAILRGIEFSISERIGYRAIQTLRMVMYDHLSRIAPRQLQHRSRGALVLRFTGDLTMLRTWISRGIARGIISGIVLAAGLGILLWLDPYIAMAMFGVLFLGSAVSLLIGTRLRRTTRWVRRKRSLLTSNIDEQVASMSTVQAFGRSAGETARLARQNDSLTRTLIQEAHIRGVLRSVTSASGWLGIVAGLAVGAVQIERGQASLGVVVTSITAARFLIPAVRDLGLCHEYWQRAKVSRLKVDEFMASRSMPDNEGLAPLIVREGRVELRDLAMRPGGPGATGTIEPGQIIAVVGPTGSGKSTLLAALAGLTTFERGTLRIDGQDLTAVAPASIRRSVGILSADLPLMRGTIRRNLTYRRPSASDDEVGRVVLQFGLDQVLADQRDGLETWISESGGGLSAGQRQRIALARAFLANPPILVLDEPSDHLDTAGKDALRIALGHYAGTVLFTTHDPFEMTLADRVWIMDGGRIVEDVEGATYRAQLGWINDLVPAGTSA